MKFRHAFLTVATTTVLAVAAGIPAQAATPLPPLVDRSLTTASTKTVTSDECVEAVAAAIAAGATDASTDVCTRTATLTTSPARRVTASELASARGSLSAAEYVAMSAAVNAGALYTKDFRQEQLNITDTEVQYGHFYYDGERAWIKATYRGVRGTHKCVVSYNVGIGVELTECSDSGSTYQRRIYAKWKFSALFNGFPVSWSETYALNATAQGSLWQ